MSNGGRKADAFSVRCIDETCSPAITIPASGTHTPSAALIIWNWNTVPGATGYKWNITNDYATAKDMATATTMTETGLACGMAYTRYVWAYGVCGNSSALTLNQTTTDCPPFFTCGISGLTINHLTTDGVAPVNKTTTYGTVTNIPGEPAKCWITSNLGSDHHAIAVDDATEASAGWYWQFNRKQGYKHDGTTLTPGWTITSIDETSDWLNTNDPCTIELGAGWRIPTFTEWDNVDVAGNWINWNRPFSSGLQMHAAGNLYDLSGSLGDRGSYGNYWCSTQRNSSRAWDLTFGTSYSEFTYHFKAFGFSVRCITELCPPTLTSPPSGTHLPSATQIIWNWNNVPDATGYKWNTTNSYADATDMGTAITKTETGLTCNTAYTRYVWAYNACGNSTPVSLNQTTSTCPGAPCPGRPTVTYEGQVYNTVQIGTQCWFKENLNIGTRINGALEQSNNGTIEKYCYNDLESNCNIYGGLYQWSEMMQYVTPAGGQEICPTGWHIPTDAEWTIVTTSLGGEGVAGGKMKSTGTIEAGTGWWYSPNTGATNESGFSGVPAGYRGYAGGFFVNGYDAGWWSSSEFSTSVAWYRFLYYNGSNVDRSGADRHNGFSVRCLADTCPARTSPTSGIHTTSGTQIIWNWNTASGATGYKWGTTNVYASATDMGTATTKTETGLTCNTAYARYAWAYNGCGNSTPVTLTQSTSPPPATPAEGIHVPSPTQIIWNWNTVTGATGYKWSTVNAYSGATDMGTAITNTETGLTCNTAYARYAWAYNACGNSTPITLTQTTSACFTCGSSITINHVAGAVAPVTKTTTYSTVTNIPGEPAKCWITSNLGSDHQASAVSDTTEASGGWYWQFNRKQGFKNDGTIPTPNTPWITSIVDPSDWITVNDPCNIELGTTWHIPTYTEWYNVDNTGDWTTWTGPWNSGMKLHAAGGLTPGGGFLVDRGYWGYYWSSTQIYASTGWYLDLNNIASYINGNHKSLGYSVRCVKD